MNDMKILITFYSHYEALKAKRKLFDASFPVRMISVPRSVSSSCGTAITTEGDFEKLPSFPHEALFEELDDGSFRRKSDG